MGAVTVVAVALAICFFGIHKIAPDVVGDSVADAATSLHGAGISIDTRGAEGTVIAQHPIAGERWFRYQDFVLTYTDDSGTHTVGGSNTGG